MLNTIWCLKACMLIMYSRMTVTTNYLKYVRWLAIYVSIGWVAVEIAFFTLCIPFKGYWGMPPPNPQCTTLEHYAMIQAVFNLSSDVCMLFIPIPIVLSLSLPLKQKMVLSIVFSMGLFVVSDSRPTLHEPYLTQARSLLRSLPNILTSKTCMTQPTCSGTRANAQSLFTSPTSPASGLSSAKKSASSEPIPPRTNNLTPHFLATARAPLRGCSAVNTSPHSNPTTN